MQKYVKFFCWFFWKFENMFIWHHSSIRKSRVFAQCYNEILMLRNLLGHKICWYSKFFIFLLLQLQGWRKRRITTRHPRFSDLPPSLNWIPVYFGTYMTRCDKYFNILHYKFTYKKNSTTYFKVLQMEYFILGPSEGQISLVPANPYM